MLTFTEEEFEKYLSRRTSEKEAAQLAAMALKFRDTIGEEGKR